METESEGQQFHQQLSSIKSSKIIISNKCEYNFCAQLSISLLILIFPDVSLNDFNGHLIVENSCVKQFHVNGVYILLLSYV